MREQFLCGLQISSSKRGGTDLSFLCSKFFRCERIAMILLAALLPIEVACGGSNGNQMIGSGGPRGTVHSYATGKGPTAVAAADFNGDKILDLGVQNGTDNSVSVLLGNGDGTFQQHVDYPAIPVVPGTSLTTIAVADFNGDGKQDLVTDSGLLLGNGDGTFQAMLPFSHSASETKLVNWHSTTASASTDSLLAVGDFNGDGKPDLAFTGGALLGNGDGTFRAGGAFNWGADAGPFFVGVGDFNGDSKLDVFLLTESTGSNSIIAIPGNGDGTFSFSTETTDLGFGSEVGWGLGLSDFNGDGKLDVVAGGSGNVSLWLGNGDGTFQGGSTSGTAGVVQAIAVADLNGDGKPDLVVINSTGFNGASTVNAVSILLGNGDGTFQPHVDYGTGQTAASSVAVGDFNGDGKLDLAVTTSADNAVSILLGNGDGTFESTW